MPTSQKLGTTELLYNCAVDMGLQPDWLLSGKLFSIQTQQGERYIYDAKSTINTQLSCVLAGNKFMTRTILEGRGLPGIAHLTTADLSAAEQFLATHAKIIVKPLNGTNSHDVRIVDAPEQLRNVDLEKYILEKYIAGPEFRYLVLQGRVVAVHESRYGESVAETRDLARISYPESQWDTALVDLALQAADALGLRYAAIDYLIDTDGIAHILEINSSPGMKWFHAPTSGPVVDVARLFLEAMVDDVQTETFRTTDLLGAYPTVAYS